MSRICTKCKNSIPDNEELGIVAEKYPTCNKCWAEWKEYQVMVMNEMKLDMSMSDHRKLLKKQEIIDFKRTEYSVLRGCFMVALRPVFRLCFGIFRPTWFDCRRSQNLGKKP